MRRKSTIDSLRWVRCSRPSLLSLTIDETCGLEIRLYVEIYTHIKGGRTWKNPEGIVRHLIGHFSSRFCGDFTLIYYIFICWCIYFTYLFLCCRLLFLNLPSFVYLFPIYRIVSSFSNSNLKFFFFSFLPFQLKEVS